MCHRKKYAASGPEVSAGEFWVCFGGVLKAIIVFSLIQVMDWIENHGEAFLSKHTGVGKSLHRARALQKRHDDFEDVAQVSLFVHMGFHPSIVMKTFTSIIRKTKLNRQMPQ